MGIESGLELCVSRADRGTSLPSASPPRHIWFLFQPHHLLSSQAISFLKRIGMGRAKEHTDTPPQPLGGGTFGDGKVSRAASLSRPCGDTKTAGHGVLQSMDAKRAHQTLPSD